MTADRVLRNTEVLLEVMFYSSGAPADADGAVTVTITGADGTVLVQDAVTTKVPATTGRYQHALDPQADLAHLTADWTGTFGAVVQTITTLVEIVGGFYVAIADIRALEGLSDEAKFSTALLGERRRWFEDLAENFIRITYVPRYGREILDGAGGDMLLLDGVRLRRLLGVKVDGVAKSTTEFAMYPEGKIVWNAGGFSVGRRNVEVTYEHGLDAPPADLRAAALEAIGAKVLGSRSAIPDTATTMTTEGGTFNLALAGINRPTGIPEVDAVLLSLQSKDLLVG